MVLVTAVTRNTGRLKRNLRSHFPSEISLSPIRDSEIEEHLENILFRNNRECSSGNVRLDNKIERLELVVENNTEELILNSAIKSSLIKVRKHSTLFLDMTFLTT